MAKTIHTVLYDDVLDGSKIVTMDNCVCQLYDIKRDYDALIRDSKENLAKPALYVLLNRNTHKAYIGETDDSSQRIASHMLKKEFWDEALAFMANDNSLTTRLDIWSHYRMRLLKLLVFMISVRILRFPNALTFSPYRNIRSKTSSITSNCSLSLLDVTCLKRLQTTSKVQVSPLLSER